MHGLNRERFRMDVLISDLKVLYVRSAQCSNLRIGEYHLIVRMFYLGGGGGGGGGGRLCNQLLQ